MYALRAGPIQVDEHLTPSPEFESARTGIRAPRAGALRVDVQGLSALPRVVLSGASVPSDLGSYHLFNCTGTGSGRSCGIDISLDATTLTSSTGTVTDYLQVGQLALLSCTLLTSRRLPLLRHPAPRIWSTFIRNPSRAGHVNLLFVMSCGCTVGHWVCHFFH
ncbi:MAG: hypothetical protein EOO65_05505, partial [Methanosarcinales archaeon]